MDKTLTVRGLPDEVYRALQQRAARSGRSVEDEIREVLLESLQPSERIRMGDALAALGQSIGLQNADLDVLERTCRQHRQSQ